MAISGPIALYNNLPIEPQFYQPSRFVIEDITRGRTTLITTSEDHNYVVGQLCRLIIPSIFGSFKLNDVRAYVISVPADDQVVLDFDSRGANAFISSPYTATITNIVSVLNTTVITANNSFLRGNSILIGSVSGMTEINDLVGEILSVTSSSFTLDIDSSTFTAYTSGGVATLYNVPQNQAQILAIGDINQGAMNTVPSNTQTVIPGSFENVSPL